MFIFLKKKSSVHVIYEGTTIQLFRNIYAFWSTGTRSDVDEGDYFSHRSCATWTELSRENMVFKNDILFLTRDQCAFVTRSRPKRQKTESNRIENLDF